MSALILGENPFIGCMISPIPYFENELEKFLTEIKKMGKKD